MVVYTLKVVPSTYDLEAMTLHCMVTIHYHVPTSLNVDVTTKLNKPKTSLLYLFCGLLLQQMFMMELISLKSTK